MRRHEGGQNDRHTRVRVVRVAGMVVAVALGVVAVWLIVTSDNAQHTKIGALAGFWALLIGAYPILGMRTPPAAAAGPGTGLDVRNVGHLERTEDAAARVEYERRLQMMVRHEIQTALGSQLASLRAEVAALRSEILEQVGGQIRLERIETTRMIGSDIEALQHEVRQLKVASQSSELRGLAGEADRLVQSMDDAVSRQRAAAEAEHAARVERLTKIIEADPQTELSPEIAEPAAPAAPVAPAEPVEVAEAPAPADDDPFAGMPRIAPFTEVDDDETERSELPSYAGRRRAGDPHLPGGRHAGAEADWSSARPSGGRRHRAEDGADILAEILRREGLRQ